MASNVERPAPRLRWLRAFIAGLVAEVVLMAISVPFFASMADPVPTLSMIIPPASLVVFTGAGYWTARSALAGTKLLNGALAGILAVGIYVLLIAGVWAFVPVVDLSASLSPAYLLAHALKILGGALGGWIAARRT